MSGVLVVRLDSAGDVLLAGPAVRAAAASASVTLLCGPLGRPSAQLLPGVDRVAVFEAPWIAADPPPVDAAATAALVTDLRERRFDAAAILTSFHQSALPTALLLRLADIPRIAAISEDYPGSLLDVRLPEPGLVHEAERALRIVGALGCELPEGDDGRLQVRPAEREVTVAEPYVVVHPGASVPARAWAPRHFRSLIARLAAAGIRPVVSGSPAERELTAYVASGTPDAIDLGGRTSLAGLAALLRDATAAVVGNTGPAHLAAAVQTPVVSIFAATVEPERWRPWAVPHVLFHEPPPCAACRARRCPLEVQLCLDRIGVSPVLRAVLRLAAPARQQSLTIGGPR